MARADHVGQGRKLHGSTSRSSRLATWPVLAAFITVLLVLLGVSQLPVGRAFLRSTGLDGPRGSYTSISFSGVGQLPEQLRPGAKELPVRFEITNSGAAARNYRWSILLAVGGHSREAAAGELTVAAGGTSSVARDVGIACEPGPVQLTVELANPQEHVDAQMECKA